MKLLELNGHLNEEGIALFTEGLVNPEVYKTLPDPLKSHVDECMECKQKILDLFEIFKDDEEALDQIRKKSPRKEIIIESPGKMDKPAYYRYLMIGLPVAAVVVLFLGIYILLKPESKPTSEELFSKYFHPYQNLVTMKGDENIIADAMYFYDLEMWDSAMIYFEKTPASDADSITRMFYYANTLLAEGEGNKAAGLLEKVISADDERFRTQAKWYLGLIYIKTGRSQEALEIMYELSKNGGFYSKKAIELLKEIN